MKNKCLFAFAFVCVCAIRGKRTSSIIQRDFYQIATQYTIPLYIYLSRNWLTLKKNKNKNKKKLKRQTLESMMHD